MTKRYLKDWAYSKIIDYQLTSKAFGSLACRLGGYFMYFKFVRKNCKKMLTDLSDYVNIFLACDAHVQCASGSVVEHLLAKEGAAGSIPVSRLFFCPFLKGLRGICNYSCCILCCIKSKIIILKNTH